MGVISTENAYIGLCDECESSVVRIYPGDTLGHVVVHNRREFIAALREQGWLVAGMTGTDATCFTCIDM